MIREADEVLRAMIGTALGDEVPLSFEPPAVARATGGSGATLLDVHLVAIAERRDLSAAGFSQARGADGTVVRTETPRYISLTYWLSAWGADAASEHQLLGDVLSRMTGIDHVPTELLTPGLRVNGLPVQMTVAAGQSVGERVADVWSSLGEPMKAGIELTLLVPIDVAGRTEMAALVLERRLRMAGPPLPPAPAMMAPPGIPAVLMPAPGPPRGAQAAPAAAGAPASFGGADAEATPVAPEMIEELVYGPEPGSPPTVVDRHARAAGPTEPDD